MKRFILLSAALLILVWTAAASPATAPTDWKHVEYFDPSTSELHLQLTQPGSTQLCNWTGGVYVLNVNGPDYTGWGCSGSYVWAKSCTGAAQTVQFTKKLFLPGGASDLDVSLQSLGNKPLVMGIDINGSVALSTAKSVHKLDIKSKGRIFKPGINTITVHAKKGATGKAPCNASGAEYGVFAQISAKFSSNLVVTPPVQSGIGFAGTYKVTNAGPSDESYTTVSFGAYTSHLTDISSKVGMGNARILMTGPGIDSKKCLYSYSATYYKAVSYTGYSVACPITALKAGETATINVVYGYDLPPNTAFYEEWPITWGASGDLADPNTVNNGGSRLQNACRNDPAKPDPRCKQ